MNTIKALFSTGKNDWETPQELFDELDDEFHFTLDPCATHETAKCLKYYTEEINGLKQDWTGETVFCNPPYSDKYQNEWVRKCYEHGKTGKIAVMLIPARTDTKRFHDYIYNNAEIRFIRGRLKFGNSINSAPFPSMIVIFGSKTNEMINGWLTMLMPTVVLFYYPEENLFRTTNGNIVTCLWPLITPNDLYLFRHSNESMEIVNRKYGIKVKLLYPMKKEV